MAGICSICGRDTENPFVVGEHLSFCLLCENYKPVIVQQGISINGNLIQWKDLELALFAIAELLKDMPSVSGKDIFIKAAFLINFTVKTKV